MTNNIAQNKEQIKEAPAPCPICGEPATNAEYCEAHFNAIETPDPAELADWLDLPLTDAERFELADLRQAQDSEVW